MTEVPRTSFGAGTRCPPSEPRLPSCCVCRPKSIALTQPVVFAFGVSATVSDLRDLVDSVWSALVIGRWADDRLRDVRRLEGTAERQANSAADDARCHCG